MYIRTTIGKFTSKLKCDMWLSYIKSEIIPNLKSNSKVISLRTIIIGEGQTLGVATYESEKDFNETNKWLGPLLKNAAQELDGKFESLAGDVVISYDKPIVKDT
mgnify:CR=1 FL=1